MNSEARRDILASIRTHLATSLPYDKHEPAVNPVNPVNPVILSTPHPIQQFKENLHAVNAHCLIARDHTEIVHSLTQIISAHRAQYIAISDMPLVKELLYLTDLEIEELAIAPSAPDIFRFDVGITSAQAAIAETGTLVLDSAYERHRLVSLVPPVHIAIVDGSRICRTLSEALALIRQGKEISPAVTFVTGPSRTADIELTLAIGVHGPQEVYVIVNGST